MLGELKNAPILKTVRFALCLLKIQIFFDTVFGTKLIFIPKAKNKYVGLCAVQYFTVEVKKSKILLY